MALRFFYILLLAAASLRAGAQAPKLGNDTLLDVATWNVEWLGESGYGPTDEVLQFENVKNVMTQTGFDVIALQEMSHPNAFFNLSDALFATYGSINSTFQATQRMSFFYKKSMFELIPPLSKNILTQYSNSDFATRPPLQVALKTLGGSRTDTLYFIVVHLKAHTGNATERQEAYYKRQAAAGRIKDYAEQYLAGKKYIVLGDWNDDLNTSLQNGMETPFKQWLNSGYIYATRPLTDAGKKSYAFGNKMIDHILMAKSLDTLHINASAKVFDNAGDYIANFSNTTSDHYPVYAFFDWKKLTTLPAVQPSLGFDMAEQIQPLLLYPNPAAEYISTTQPVDKITVYSIAGTPKAMFEQPASQLDITVLQNGVYVFKIETGGQTLFERVIVCR